MELSSLIIDLAIMLMTAGVINIVFKRIHLPIILGYILSGIVEENLLKGMSLNKGNFASILQHPIAMIFLVIGILYFAWCVRRTILAQKKRAEA